MCVWEKSVVGLTLLKITRSFEEGKKQYTPHMGIKWKRKANIDIFMWQRRKSRGAKAVELCSIDEAALGV